MKCHLTIPLALFSTFTFAALSTGSPLFLALSILLLLILITGWISVMRASATMTLSATLPENAVQRGNDIRMTLTFRHHSLLPIAPVSLLLRSAPGVPVREIRLMDLPGKQQTLSFPFHAAHVGVSTPGVESITIEDLLGIFSLTRAPDLNSASLVVLPGTFETEPLKYAPGEPGSEIMARATEDLSAPSDVRVYQTGDAMKKIHWKLSLRKNELMVRRFEEPELPDALILMDCSKPPSWGHPEAEADLRDALLETAASVLEAQMKTDHGVRLPLFGQHPIDIEKGMGIGLAFENLARTDFSETDRFERVLMMEATRLRKVGSVVIISARLNSDIVDMMIRIRRLGPFVRLYLVTFAPDDAQVIPMIARLRQAGINVDYVRPMPA